MTNTTATVPYLLEVMIPVIFIYITSLRHLYAIQTKTVEVVEELLTDSLDCCLAELFSTSVASTFRNLAVEVDETGTIEDLLHRLPIIIVEWQKFGLE
jgi:hypothetical protein